MANIKEVLLVTVFLGLIVVALISWQLGADMVRKANLLHQTVLAGDVGQIEDLLNKGVAIDGLSTDNVLGIRFRPYPHAYENNVTPLYVAVSEGNLRIVKLLVERGADVNHAESPTYSILGIAIMEFMPSIPMHGGPSPPPVDVKTRTEIVKVLVLAGADLHHRQYPPAESPLEMATRLELIGLYENMMQWRREMERVPNQSMYQTPPMDIEKVTK